MKKVSGYKSNFWNFQHLLWLLLLTLVCYWPLTFGIFSAKNDNITQFLPVRFHVSEALRNFHLPLWTPYMYLGYPIHGDMQGGAWNPVVWFLSLIGRYNVTSLHWEILISIFIAGMGMYRLLGIRNISPIIKLAGAGAYMMCGYITDVAGSNLPFLWGAAYIPFVFAYYYHLLATPGINYALKTAISLSLLLVSAYPSFFILTFYVMAAAFIFIIVRKIIAKDRPFLKKLLSANAVMTLGFLGLSAVAIFSYLHILPFYSRGSGIKLGDVLINSFHPSCTLSFALPSVPIKNPASFATDLISRNSYFNIILLLFGVCYVWIRKTPLTIFTFSGILFFYLFSLGDFTPVREWSYHLLPLMDTFRHPSNGRLFVIIGGIVTGVFAFQNFLEQKRFPKHVKITAIAFLILILLPLAFSFGDIEIGIKIKDIFSSGKETRLSLKNFFDELSLNDLIVINVILQSIFLLVFILFLRTLSLRRLMVLIILNSFLFAQLVIPYTLVSKTSPGKLNALLNNYPEGYPIPDKNSSIRFNSSDALDHFELIGISGFYNKKISTTDVVYTPTFMTLTEKAMGDSLVKHTVLSKPYAYLTGDGNFELSKFRNNGFEFETTTNDTTSFCLQQLHMPGWKCFVDGKAVNIQTINTAYMSVKIPAGNHKVKFVYRPAGLIVFLSLSVLSLSGMIFLLTKNRIKKNA